MARPFNNSPSSGAERGIRQSGRLFQSVDEESLPEAVQRRQGSGYSQQYGHHGATRSSSSPFEVTPSTGLETGVIEKVMPRYGFIVCHERDLRLFFHVSQLSLEGDITSDSYKPGAEVEFRVDKDPRTGKPIAVQIRLNAGAQRPAVEAVTLSGQRYEGVIDAPPKQKAARRTRSLPQNSSRGTNEMGRLSYFERGECFFLPFSSENMADKRYQLQKGDKVSFLIGKEKLTQRSEAFSVTVLEPTRKNDEPVMLRGVVRELRGTFGFIERSDNHSRIFFHYTELLGADPKVGDSVEFSIRDQLGGNACACRVSILPEGSVKEVEGADRVGTIEAGLDSTRKGEEVQAGLLNCVINGSEEALEFSEREFEGNFTVLRGDRVHFRCRTGRNGVRKAVNVALYELVTNPNRERGVISALKESSHFGFIRCCQRDEGSRVFFHFNEWMEAKSRPGVGDEVEFEFVEAPNNSQRRAIRIQLLQPGMVEQVQDEFKNGVVHSAPKLMRMSSRSSIGSLSESRDREMEPGLICMEKGSAEMIPYVERDCSDTRSVPAPGDEVVFRLCENKCTGRFSAVHVSVIRAAEVQAETGSVVALKSNFGFVELSDHREQLYFKIKNEEYKLLDEVSFVISRRGGRCFAEDITILPPGSIDMEVRVEGMIDGIVVKPTNDDSAERYPGQIEIPSTSLQTLVGSKTESCSTELQPYQDRVVAMASEALAAGTTLTVPFTVLSLVDFRATPQKGEQVIFSLAVHRNRENTLHAVNLTQKKALLRGRIDSLKEGFGFIATEDSSSAGTESLFFHESEVVDDQQSGRGLEVGDTVEFSVVYNQKRGKSQACNVHRVTDQRPDRLSRKMEGLTFLGPRAVVRRQPRQPEPGSSGFTLPHVERTCGEYYDLPTAQDADSSNATVTGECP